uniref:hypothetical protein n=1 Tax=Segeticoccus rhizosphaerae TaxID=1104777 RepID=UPI0019393DEC
MGSLVAGEAVVRLGLGVAVGRLDVVVVDPAGGGVVVPALVVPGEVDAVVGGGGVVTDSPGTGVVVDGVGRADGSDSDGLTGGTTGAAGAR